MDALLVLALGLAAAWLSRRMRWPAPVAQMLLGVVEEIHRAAGDGGQQ